MPDFTPSSPEGEQIALTLVESKFEIKNFTEYSFNTNFLTPTDGFSFTVADESITDEQKAALKPGAQVQLSINGLVQSSGYIDSIAISASRDSGIVYRIEGRDALAQAVDACADPTVSLKEGSTLEDAMKTLFTPYGWSSDNSFLISAEADKNVKTGEHRHKSQKSDAKGFGRKALKQYALHQMRPYPREGVFEFASRLANRFGLWIWSTADGYQLIVAKPNFEQEPSMQLYRNLLGTTNVLEGTVKYDMTDQPTYIVADSYSGGGEFGRGRVKVILGNTAVKLTDGDEDALPAVLQKYVDAGAKVLGGPLIPAANVMKAPRPRILYLHDDESQDADQLENYVRREMALSQRKSLTANYTVEGHGQNTAKGWKPWVIDSTVKVVDEVAGLTETLYVLGLTFNKSRGSGTSTSLELIRLNTLVFSDGGAKSQ